MVIDPCRRAQEHNDMVKAVRDWFVETTDTPKNEFQSDNRAILPENLGNEHDYIS